MSDAKSTETHLKWGLRILGTIDLMALIAVLMPRTLMTEIHGLTGLGPFPEGAIVTYLARSASAMYALHGALIIWLSLDVKRYAPAIRFLAYAAVVHGGAILAIDVAEQMPFWWRIAEGPCFAGTGLIILWLQRRFERSLAARGEGWGDGEIG